MPVVLFAHPGSYGLPTGLTLVTGEDQSSGAPASAGVAATVSSSHPPRHAATARKRFVGTPASSGVGERPRRAPPPAEVLFFPERIADRAIGKSPFDEG